MASLDLTAKLGPLPVWAWGGLIGGGIAIGSYVWQQRGTADDAGTGEGDAQESYPDDDELAASPAPGGDPYLPGYGYSGTAGETAPPTGTPTPTDNVAWQSLVSRELIAKGYSPGVVENAIGRYLRHECVDSQQYALVEMAITAHPVPDPPGELTLCPPPVVAPPPANATVPGTNVPVRVPGRYPQLIPRPSPKPKPKQPVTYYSPFRLN